MRIIQFLLLVIVFTSQAAFAESEQEPSRVEELEKRIKKLEEKENTAKQSAPDTAGSQSSTATGISRAFNPAISVNGLFLGSYNSRENNNPNADVKTGLDIQEVEVQFSANIDSYLKGNVVISMPNANSISLEEATADTLVTNNLAFRAGKFHAAFGKQNLLHTHAFPFIDAPLVNNAVFGNEGLNEAGGSLDYLLPLPWFSEFTFQMLGGKNTALLNSQFNNDLAYLSHAKNLWDLNEDTTMELGGSYLYGKNSAAVINNESHAVGGDLTFKWNPASRSKYKTIIWQTEFLAAFKGVGIDPSGVKHYDDKGGFYSQLQYQFARQWWVEGRYDYFGLYQLDRSLDRKRYSGLLAFVPSEFSALRLQYNYIDQSRGRDEHQILLQLNFTMGSHPAHQY